MVEMLVDLYQQKLDLFKQLGKLSTAMAEFAPSQLGDDDAISEKFLKLLDERAVLIGKIDDLTEKITIIETKEPTPDVGLLRRALQEEMVKIQEQNEVVENIVNKSLIELREEARKLQSGKQSNRAYIGQARSIEGAFIDKKR